MWNHKKSLNNSQASIDILLKLEDTYRLREQYPNLSKDFLSREFLLILNAVRWVESALHLLSVCMRMQSVLTWYWPHSRPFSRHPMGPKDLERPEVTKDSIVYIDPISKVPSESITYGYTTDFTIFMMHEHKLLDLKGNHRQVVSMIGIKPICEIFSYAELPRHFKYLLGVTGTLKCMTQDQVSTYFVCN